MNRKKKKKKKKKCGFTKYSFKGNSLPPIRTNRNSFVSLYKGYGGCMLATPRPVLAQYYLLQIFHHHFGILHDLY